MARLSRPRATKKLEQSLNAGCSPQNFFLGGERKKGTQKNRRGAKNVRLTDVSEAATFPSNFWYINCKLLRQVCLFALKDH